MSSPNQSTTWPARGRRARAWVCLLVLAMFCAQWLGLIHRVVHTSMGATAAVAGLQAVSIDESVRSLSAAPAGILAHLGAPAKSDPDCRLYDQIGLSDGLTAAPLLWMPAVIPPALVMAAVFIPAACELVFDARGPPLNP